MGSKHVVEMSLEEAPEISAEELARLASMADEDIDFSDIPNQADQEWLNATNGWPRPGKTSVTIRMDNDTLAFFKSFGRGYQSHINHVLRTYMAAQQKAKNETATTPSVDRSKGSPVR